MKNYIFTKKIKKEKNNDYYYGLNAGDYINSKLYIEIIRESEDNIDLPQNVESFILSKHHFIIKIISENEKEIKKEVFYSNKTFDNITIFNYKNYQSELMQLINNGGAYTYEGIDELFLVYDTEDIEYFDFRGYGTLSYYYNKNMNFSVIENGFNLKDFNDFGYNKGGNFIFLYLFVYSESIFQTNIYPELVDPKEEISAGSHLFEEGDSFNVSGDFCTCLCLTYIF
jgi:hypothetical protein